MIKGGHGMVEDDRGVILERDELSGLLRRLEAGGCSESDRSSIRRRAKLSWAVMRQCDGVVVGDGTWSDLSRVVDRLLVLTADLDRPVARVSQ